jgi:hypothetical protein
MVALFSLPTPRVALVIFFEKFVPLLLVVGVYVRLLLLRFEADRNQPTARAKK